MSLNAFWMNNALTTTTALLWHNESLSSAGLDFSSETMCIANALEDCGVTHNEVVACILGPSKISHSLLWAITSYGAQFQALSPHFEPEFIIREINCFEARTLFIDACYLPLLRQLRPLLIHLEMIIVVGDSINESDALLYYSFSEIIADMSQEYHWPALEENTPALISYEKNIRGEYKACSYNHRQMLLTALSASSQDVVQLSKHDRIYWGLALHSEMGWVIPLAAMLIGAELRVGKEDECLQKIVGNNYNCLFVKMEQYQRVEPSISHQCRAAEKIRIYFSSPETSEEWDQSLYLQKDLLELAPLCCDISLTFNWETLISQDPMSQTSTHPSELLQLPSYIFPQHPILM